MSNAPDIARAKPKARRALTRSFAELAREFEGLLGEAAGDETERALAAVATCVGGVAIARSLADEELVERLLSACRAAVRRELGHVEQDQPERRAIG